ncbi:Solute carrier family 35 member G1 like protein [Argiope bruennichi]|uniref:Solute carrier family 35 member G1 like protein n=1 Tax=Argiope bruennichi TaxID=94029 RepID=A0A8T0FVA9_ARGBR|nr:Solute carrier family 35 member G1 like protein [Argiope bruennichi]
MMAAVFFSGDAAAMKMITSLHPAQVSLYRFFALFVMSMPETVKSKEYPFGPKDDRIHLIIRGVFGGISLFLSYTAYRSLPLGEASVIMYCTPITVTVAAWIFLKEPCSIIQSILVIVTVVGVAFTTKLPSQIMGNTVIYTKENIYGFLSAMTACLCRTIQSICIRKSKNVHHAIVMFNFGWMTVIEGLILMAVFADYKLQECGTEWIYILLIGFFSYCGQNLLTLALKCECAGPVSTVMSATAITISFLLQVFLFHESTDISAIIGAVLVGLCIVGAGLIKFMSTLPENLPQCKLLKYVESDSITKQKP